MSLQHEVLTKSQFLVTILIIKRTVSVYSTGCYGDPQTYTYNATQKMQLTVCEEQYKAVKHIYCYHVKRIAELILYQFCHDLEIQMQNSFV